MSGGRRGLPRLALPALFVGAALFHALISRGHVTPFAYPDELLYQKLAQAFASGTPFVIRGEPYFFSAFLAPLVQAPAWLFDAVPDALATVKVINAAVMTSAVFPVYWLARLLDVRRRDAFLVAAAAVAAPWLAYHSFLLSEPVAYPLFFLVVATSIRVFEHPSGPRQIALVGALLAAVLTRIQFVVLPAAYVVAVLVVPMLRHELFRPALRRHALSVAPLCVLGIVALGFRGPLLGDYYSDLPTLTPTYSPADVAAWASRTAALLPWATGWLVLPGAITGLLWLGRRAQSRADAAFAVTTVSFALLTFLEIGFVRAADWHHPTVERYVIYLLPLLFIALLAYAQRGAPVPKLAAGVALALAGIAWLLPFPTSAPYNYVVDSPTGTSYAFFGQWLDARSASLSDAFPELATGVVSLALIVFAFFVLRGRGHRVVAAGTVLYLLVSTVAFYRMDAGVARGVKRAWLASPPDWLDRSGLGRADYLELPGAVSQLGREAETWNRSVARAVYLRAPRAANDRYPSVRARIDERGSLLVDGAPARAGLLLVNDFGSEIQLEGTTVLRPRPGLVLVRIPDAPHVQTLATGLYFDRWAAPTLRFEAWPAAAAAAVGGRYRVSLALPRGRAGRTIRLTVEGGVTSTIAVAPGETVHVELPAPGLPVPALRITASRADLVDERVIARHVSVRVPVLEYVPG